MNACAVQNLPEMPSPRIASGVRIALGSESQKRCSAQSDSVIEAIFATEARSLMSDKTRLDRNSGVGRHRVGLAFLSALETSESTRPWASGTNPALPR